jgi:hypothetical protein
MYSANYVNAIRSSGGNIKGEGRKKKIIFSSAPLASSYCHLSLSFKASVADIPSP